MAAPREALIVADVPFLITCYPFSVEASAAPTHTAVPAAKPLSRSDTAEPTKRSVMLETLISLNR
ncbi:MAG: hypothetical protein NWF07_02520 [Candidatus Bathyarchaeota archaeon]|nr:hypothetical protein [Candidatus Bathyarchaeota archaeon]